MIEMLTGKHPWPEVEDNLPFVYKLIHLKDDDLPEFKLDENASSELKDFLRQTFIINYNLRPTSNDLLKHDFIKSY